MYHKTKFLLLFLSVYPELEDLSNLCFSLKVFIEVACDFSSHRFIKVCSEMTFEVPEVIYN